MPKKAIKVEIDVKDYALDESQRRLSVEVRCDPGPFKASDFCAAQGAVTGLSLRVKEAVRSCILSYISSGPEFIREAKKEKEASTPKRTKRELPLPIV